MIKYNIFVIRLASDAELTLFLSKMWSEILLEVQSTKLVMLSGQSKKKFTCPGDENRIKLTRISCSMNPSVSLGNLISWYFIVK